MWILQDDSDKFYYLTPGQPFVVGRNQGDLIVKSDGSLSRAHAKIELTPLEKCQVTDTKSKYGTFILGDNVDEARRIDDVYTVRPNDRIRFGLQNCILTFIHQKIVVSTTSLSAEHRHELVNIMKEIGGTILKDWDNSCTHLTVTNTKLTAKLACALAAGLPIVTIDYWRSVKAARTKGDPFPDPRNFCPRLEDSMLIKKNKSSLLPKFSRRSIFKDFLFIHFRMNQLQTYQKMIELAGGSSVFYGHKDFHKEMLSHPNSRVILYNDDNSQNEPYKIPPVDTVRNFLRRRQRRMIPETEIPLGILYSSVKSCCNPDFSYEVLFTTKREKQMVEGETLVPDTQDVVGQKGLEGRKGIVPESLVIPETESFGGGSQSANRGQKSSAGSMVNDEGAGHCMSRETRKRPRDLQDVDSEEKRKRTRITDFFGKIPAKSSRRTASTLKSENGVVDDSSDEFTDIPGEKMMSDGDILGNSCGEKEKRTRITDLPSGIDEKLSDRISSILKLDNIPVKRACNASDDEVEDHSFKKPRRDGIILRKKDPEIPEEKLMDNHKTTERTNKSREDNSDSDIFPAENQARDGSNRYSEKNSLSSGNKKASKFLVVSEEEMEIVKHPIDQEIDADENREWHSSQSKTSRERLLRSFQGDEKSMRDWPLRPEVFSGKFIGKNFKKFEIKRPQRPVIEWKRGV